MLDLVKMVAVIEIVRGMSANLTLIPILTLTHSRSEDYNTQQSPLFLIFAIPFNYLLYPECCIK